MNLRKKTRLMIGTSIASLLGVLYATSSTIMLNGFTRLEEREANRNVKRVRDAFSDYLTGFSALNYQWATWDETYAFINDGNKAYIKRNLGAGEFLTLRANLMAFINSSGKLVFSKGFKLKERQEVPIPQDFLQHLKANSSLLRKPDRLASFKGIILLSTGPMAIVSGPILASDGSGSTRGTLVLGRYLNGGEIQRLGTLTHVDIIAHRVNDPHLPVDFQGVRAALSQSSEESPIIVEPLSEKVMAGYTLLRDIYGQPALLLRVNMVREIYRQGQVSLRYLILSILGVGLFFGLATLLLLEKLVLYRLASLAKSVKGIGATGDLSLRVEIAGKDELASLAIAINGMLEELEGASQQVTCERQKADRLLLNILPGPIAEQLKQDHHVIADSFAEVTVLFADLVGFTNLAAEISPVELVSLLNLIFSAFDRLAERYGLEKIKTIGDAYMVVGGLPDLRADHAEAIAEMALDMQDAIAQFNAEINQSLSIRIGINTGPVVAGVIGIKKFIYDLWGDAVNTASRMESHGIAGCIQVSDATYQILRDKFLFEERGAIKVKGKGEMKAYLLSGRKVDKLSVVK